MSDSVLQDWVQEISWKKQTVLLTALRSPDTQTTLAVKKLTVWIREHVLKNADPMTGFMHGALEGLPLFEQIDRDFERLPLHTAHHIILAMQVIGWEHPDEQVRAEAAGFYADAVIAQHLGLESKGTYEARMTDNPDRVLSGTS